MKCRRGRTTEATRPLHPTGRIDRSRFSPAGMNLSYSFTADATHRQDGGSVRAAGAGRHATRRQDTSPPEAVLLRAPHTEHTENPPASPGHAPQLPSTPAIFHRFTAHSSTSPPT